MKATATLILVWLLAGIGAVAGSIPGAAMGPRGLFAGAALGGPLGAIAGVWICVRLTWLERADQRAASIGAAAGFLAAIPVATLNLRSPVVPVLICSLAGAGALIGAAWANARRRR